MTRPRSGLARYGASLTTCAEQAAAYGACLKASLPEVERGMCAKEFAALRQCFAAAAKAAAK
ncbi:hypothetical protein V8C86DRAFT_2718268 [Haematococcus lacustris]